MARAIARILTLATRPLPVSPAPAINTAVECSAAEVPTALSALSSTGHLQIFPSISQKRSFRISYPYARHPRPSIAFFVALRGFRNVRWRQAARKQAQEEKKLELRVKVSTEDGMSNDHQIVNIVEMLKLDAPIAMKMAFNSLKELECRACNSITEDLCKYEKIELSVLLCNDETIAKLNKEWKGSNCPTAFLSRIQHARELEVPILMLGDIVISTEAATRQAVGRGQTLLNEIRVLMIHGLLHLLGIDHEMGGEALAEMEKLEEQVLGSLDWKGRGLTKVVCEVAPYDIQL